MATSQAQLPAKPNAWNHLRLVIVLAIAVLVIAGIGAVSIMGRNPQPTVNQVDKSAPVQADGAKQNVDGTRLNVN